MNKSEYLKALDAAHAEIDELCAERFRIDVRLSELKVVANGLSRLVGSAASPKAHNLAPLIALMQENAPDPGITNALRRVLSQSGVPMGAGEIRGALESIGFGLSNYVNAGAVVHNTLVRLIRQGEVARIENSVNKTVAYALAPGHRKTLIEQLAGGVPNPSGKNLLEMLAESKNK